MLRAIARHLTFANVVASAALFVALGGVGYAATTLPKNSVTARAIRNGAVTNDKLARSAVTGEKVKYHSLDGTDIDMKKLGAVPTARGIAKITQKTTAVPVGAYVGYGLYPSASATATCDAGQSVVGGGAHVDSDATQFVNDSHPQGPNAWTAVVYNGDAAPHNMTVYAICVPSP